VTVWQYDELDGRDDERARSDGHPCGVILNLANLSQVNLTAVPENGGTVLWIGETSL